MTTPDEVAATIIRASQSGDSITNVQQFAEVTLSIWRENIRQDEISRCAKMWAEKKIAAERYCQRANGAGLIVLNTGDQHETH